MDREETDFYDPRPTIHDDKGAVLMEVLIIPLIALAVWILQYVFKGPEDNKQQARPRGPAGPRTAVKQPRRQVSDLDRFLEETRKRKQDEERKPVVLAEVVQEAPPVDRGEAVERERKAASRHRPEAKPQRPTRPERKPLTQSPVPTPRRPAPVIPLREQPAPVLLQVAPIPVPPPLSRDTPRPIQAAVGPSAARKTTPPVLVDLLKMLQTPQGAALAVVLREVLDTPVSQRRR